MGITARIDRWMERRGQRPDRLKRGLRDLLLTGVAYSVAILLLAIGGVAPGMASWLAIPTADYFWWEPLFTTPVIFFSGILAAAVMQLLARVLGGRGTFEDTLALIGLATAFATLFTLVPDTLVALGLLAGWIDPQQWMEGITSWSLTLVAVWAYMIIYLVAFLALYPRVARHVHGLKTWPARWCGWLAFLVYQGVLIVFIR